jgi:hypothetical protein
MTAQDPGTGAVSVTPLGTFYYSSLQTLLVYWQIDPSVATQLVGPGLVPAVFDGKSLINMNFERYASIGGNFDGMVDEVEFNVVAFPKQLAGSAFQLTTAQYLSGGDEAKVYGNYRVMVACDSEVAVQSGATKYGENKFLAAFPNYNVPGVNSPSVTSWTVPCTEPAPSSGTVFTLSVPAMPAINGMPVVTPSSPISAWATLVGADNKTRLVQSGRNVFGVFQTWCQLDQNDVVQPLPAGTATVTVGTGTNNPMVPLLRLAFNGAEQCVAIAHFDSAPAAASTHTLLNQPIQ